MSYIATPFPLRHQDMYSISSDDFSSDKAKTLSTYSVTNRKSPKESFPELAQDSRTLMFGLSDFINRHLTHQITKDEVLETALFCRRANSFGGPIYFPLDKWMYVVEKCNGFLPVRIDALPEASTFYPNTPFIQLRNTVAGLGELTASFEAGMVGMVSNASARLTLCRHFLDRLREWVQKDIKSSNLEVLDQTAQFLIHDFSMRACCSTEQSEVLGLAHLLVFNGSDNSNANYQAWKRGCKPFSGASIQAQAHRNAASFSDVMASFEAMRKSASRCDVPIASYITDLYNFFGCILKDMCALADKYPNETFVAREDSGDALKNVLHILGQNKANLRFLSGNSLNPEKVFAIMQGLIDNGYPATQRGIFGMGGWLIRTPNRDSLSTAMKLVAIGEKCEPVVKLSEDEGKESVPGPHNVSLCDLVPHTFMATEKTKFPSIYINYYSCGTDGPSYSFATNRLFSQLQSKCISEFDDNRDFAKQYPNHGLNGETWSDEIKKIQKEYKDKYRAETN